MLPLIRRYIKTRFVFLIAGLALGGGIVVSRLVTVGGLAAGLFVVNM